MARGGALSLARLLSGVVRVKILALSLGVGGVGVYALLLQLYATGVAIASMSLAIPIINLGRPSIVAGDHAEAGRVAGTALAVVAVNAALLVLVAAGLGEELLDYLDISDQARGLVWPIALAIMFGAFAGAFWEGLSFLCDRFDTYVRVGIIGSVAETLFVAAAAWTYGLRGAIIAMPLGSAALVLAYALLMRRDPTAREVLGRLSVRLSYLPRLFAYSAMMFATVALTNAGLTLMRSRVLVEAGAAANGYLQTATALSSYILAFVMTGFWGHLHARAAAEGDTPAVRAELARSLELGMLIAFAGCGAAAVLAPFLIPLFYSSQFGGGVAMTIAYMPGEFCFQLLSMLIAYQLTINRRRLYLALNLGYVGLLAGLGFLLIPALGAFGYVAAHVAASLAMVAAAAAIAWRTGQVTAGIGARALALLIVLAAVCAALFAGRGAGQPLWVIALAFLPFALGGCLVLYRLLRPSPATA
ncbi:MAG TPA: hypothetical protein VFS45_02420 [Sphingomicrobium sp.]|nr:hypothetical protein [Sphingomicrobium sp.]